MAAPAHGLTQYQYFNHTHRNHATHAPESHTISQNSQNCHLIDDCCMICCTVLAVALEPTPEVLVDRSELAARAARLGRLGRGS